MNIIQEAEVLANKNLAAVFEDLKQAVLRAAREAQPLHEVEKALWEQLLRLGREALTRATAGGGSKSFSSRSSMTSSVSRTTSRRRLPSAI
jgi:hypothetical protein